MNGIRVERDETIVVSAGTQDITVVHNGEPYKVEWRKGLKSLGQMKNNANILTGYTEETEKHIHYDKRFRSYDFKIKNRLDAISHATCGMAIDIGAKAIVVSSMSGVTVRMVSRFRGPTDIIGMATNKAIWYKLALSWGVIPVLSEQFNSTDVLFYHALIAAKNTLSLEKGDSIVMTGGITNGQSGNTNLIKIETI